MDLSGHGHGGSSSSSRGSTRSSSGNGNLQEERGEIQIENTREMERTLGLFDLIMIGIGGTVGAGVFATAGLVSELFI
jgi:amino acid permease